MTERTVNDEIAAFWDEIFYGVSFSLDGKRTDPSDVFFAAEEPFSDGGVWAQPLG